MADVLGELNKLVAETIRERKEIEALEEKPNKSLEDYDFLIDYYRKDLQDAFKLREQQRKAVEKLEAKIEQLKKEKGKAAVEKK